MADEKDDMVETQLGDDDLPVALAIRTSVNTQTGEKRMLITLRAGTGCEKITFNFGSYGGNPSTRGGDPGDPPCP